MSNYFSTAFGLTAAMLLSGMAAPPDALGASTSDGRVSFNISSEPLPHWGFVSTPNYVGSVYLFESGYYFNLEGRYDGQHCVGSAGFSENRDGTINMSLRFQGGDNCYKPNGKVEHFKLYGSY